MDNMGVVTSISMNGEVGRWPVVHHHLATVAARSRRAIVPVTTAATRITVMISRVATKGVATSRKMVTPVAAVVPARSPGTTGGDGNAGERGVVVMNDVGVSKYDRDGVV